MDTSQVPIAEYMTILLLLSLPFVLVLTLDSILRGFYLAVRLFARTDAPSQYAIRNTQYTIHNLGVLILARDEEAIIGNTVRHLCQLAYPQDRYQVMVAADNCQDATAAVARSAGAQVWERHEPEEVGKGAALRWFTQTARHVLDNFDAILILDADSRVEPDFLARINDLLLQGAQCIQGFLMPVPVIGSRASLLAAYSELLSQHIDASARWRLGWPAQLYGTGMTFRTDLLKTLTPRLRTKVEDVELTLATLRCAQDTACAATTPVFAPHAIVYDPKPASAGRVVTQRARWFQGQAAIWRRFWRDLSALFVRGNIGTKALVFSLLLKPKTLVFAIKLLALGLLASLAMVYRDTAFVTLSHLLMTAALIDMVYYLVGLVWIENSMLYARALLAAPLYPAIWIWGIATATRSRDTWLRARE